MRAADYVVGNKCKTALLQRLITMKLYEPIMDLNDKNLSVIWDDLLDNVCHHVGQPTHMRSVKSAMSLGSRKDPVPTGWLNQSVDMVKSCIRRRDQQDAGEVHIEFAVSCSPDDLRMCPCIVGTCGVCGLPHLRPLQLAGGGVAVRRDGLVPPSAREEALPYVILSAF